MMHHSASNSVNSSPGLLGTWSCCEHLSTQPFAAASFPRIFSVARQNGATVAISTLSSGLWAPLMVGPYDTASMPETFSRMMPHSRPAWTAPTWNVRKDVGGGVFMRCKGCSTSVWAGELHI